MATISDVSQATVNGMNANGTGHEDHTVNHESPSKSTLLNSQDGPRIPAKIDVHKEKTPVPENLEHSKLISVATVDNKTKEAVSPEKHDVIIKTMETTKQDPAGIIIVPVEPKKIDEVTVEVSEKPSVDPLKQDVISKKTDDELHSKAADEEATTESKEHVQTVEQNETITKDIEMTDAEKKEELGHSEPIVEHAEKTTEEKMDVTEKPAKKTGGRQPAVRKVAATPKKPVPEAEGATDDVDQSKLINPKRTPRKVKATEEALPTKEVDKTPLLEAPLIVEGKRSRQRVERLAATVLSTPDRKELEIPSGKGEKLGEISFVEAMISKTPTNDLKTLHKILYNKAGNAAEIKRNLRQFSGFNFDSDSKEFEKKKKTLDHVTLLELKGVVGVLGLEHSNKKEEIIDLILQYLMEPTDKGNTPTVPKRATSRKRTAPNSSSKRKTPKRKVAKKSGDKSEISNDESEEEPEEESEEEKEELVAEPEKEKSATDEEETAEPAPKKAKKSKILATPTTSKKLATAPAKTTKKSAFPTDADLKLTIKELLKGVNLEEVTMKEMTAKVYDKYPGVDLTNKKDFIKDTVKALLASND